MERPQALPDDVVREIARSSLILDGLGRANDLPLHHGQINVLLGAGGGDAFGRLEGLYKLTPSSGLYGFAEEHTQRGFMAGLGYQLEF